MSLYERQYLPTPVDIDEYRCVYLSKYIYIYIYVYLSIYQCVVGVVVLHSVLLPNVISEIMVFRYF